MEAGKCVAKAPFGSVIIGVLILGLFIAQASVEARSCCDSKAGRNCYQACVRRTGATKLCARSCGCRFTRENRCPSSHPWANTSNFQNSDNGDEFEEQSNVTNENKINEYCKLGCAFSVCKNINTPQDSELDEAVERCNDACFDLCNKNSNIAVVTVA
ncbi:alpha-hordothionin-like isoform X2 [Papaver somniferum]|uniref:alpha-hordothionin-like isoform X2 n=1 Tax=Papaver somniferum TaxID=3469 RepID=UPI000E704127|nr:alpha-hordothionin-like isoform X2 [Papaver somniferum]